VQPSSGPAKSSTVPDRPPPADRPARSASCLNCGTPLDGPFCSACGQRDVPPYPTVRELVVDAFWELSGWDGRFLLTVRSLLRRPGMLTREFLEGRRARYVSPLRLYLMASLVYFLAAAAAPDLEGPSRSRGTNVGLGVNVDMGGETQTPEQKARALEEVRRAPPVMQPFLRRAIEDPDGLKRRIIQTMPRTFFVLLPVFAAVVALFYRGNRYPAHLYFSIHLHAFIFVVLTVPEVASFTRIRGLADVIGIAATISIPIYATLALRRVYGGSLVGTLGKEVGIAVVYGLASLVAFVVTLYWVSVAA
jgi:hypothetical protein